MVLACVKRFATIANPHMHYDIAVAPNAPELAVVCAVAGFALVLAALTHLKSAASRRWMILAGLSTVAGLIVPIIGSG